jgi:hypothetical protein
MSPGTGHGNLQRLRNSNWRSSLQNVFNTSYFNYGCPLQLRLLFLKNPVTSKTSVFNNHLQLLTNLCMMMLVTNEH